MDHSKIPRPRCPGRPAGTPRRAVLQGAASLALAWLAPAGAGGQEPQSARPAPGDRLVKVGDARLAPLTPADIAGTTPTLAWPMTADGTVRSNSRLNRIVMVRVDPTAMAERTRTRAADGVVAYSAVCTHSGCEVATYLAGEQALYCDCHQSKFDPLDQAYVLDGPAPRPLPALPLKVVDGRLEVAGSFTARPGFEQG